MNEIEAIGDLAQGGLTARAVEPAAGEAAADGHTDESACLNCGTPLIGSHCHACGQRGHQHKTLGAFFHDLVHGVLHFEGKIWRTLPLLAGRPGKLTREYIDGRRASYVSPIALFLFTIFLLFAVFSAMGGADALTESVDLDTGQPTAAAHEATTNELERVQARLADEEDADDRERLTAQVAQLEQQRRFIATAMGVAGPDAADEERDRGVVLARLGREVEAADALRRYLELVPGAPDLARVQIMLDQLDADS